MAETWTADFLDGIQPFSRPAMISIDGTSCTFQIDGMAAPLTVSPLDILRYGRVNDEFHVEIGSSTRRAHSVKLIVRDEGFEAAFLRFLSLTDTRPLAGLGRTIRRVPFFGWLAVLVLAFPAVYLLLTGLALAALAFVPVDFEVEIGDSIFESLEEEFPPCDDAELQVELQAMVDELKDPASPYELRVSIVRSEDANAFALPGGRIVVLSGLLAKSASADEIAGVLAHEVAHVERRHSMRHLARSVGILFFMSAAVGGGAEGLELLEAAGELSGLLLNLHYSREAESEADALAVAKLHAHQRTVEGLAGFFARMEKEAGIAKLENALHWLSTHPVTADRIEMLRRARQEENFKPRPWHLEGIDWKRVERTCAEEPEEERPGNK